MSLDITLRQYFAAHAPLPAQPMDLQDHVAFRYRYADAMIKAGETMRAGTHLWKQSCDGHECVHCGESIDATGAVCRGAR